jgi:hypothetical protein
MFGGNPVGTNPEITRQLSGAIPKHINFLERRGRPARQCQWANWLTRGARLTFFHQLSGRDMEIHSAGPDQDHVDGGRFGVSE